MNRSKKGRKKNEENHRGTNQPDLKEVRASAPTLLGLITSSFSAHHKGSQPLWEHHEALLSTPQSSQAGDPTVAPATGSHHWAERVLGAQILLGSILWPLKPGLSTPGWGLWCKGRVRAGSFPGWVQTIRSPVLQQED